MDFKHPIAIAPRTTRCLTATPSTTGRSQTLPPTIPTFWASLPLAIVEQKPLRATCASDPRNGAQLLIPSAPKTPLPPSPDNLRFCPSAKPQVAAACRPWAMHNRSSIEAFRKRRDAAATLQRHARVDG